jgi:hypothetical protein
MVGPGADGLHPAQGRRERSQANGQVEGEKHLGAGESVALCVGQSSGAGPQLLERALTARRPQTVLLDVRSHDHLDVRGHGSQPVDQLGCGIGREGDLNDHLPLRRIAATIVHPSSGS